MTRCKHSSGATPMVSGGVGAVVGAALVAIFRFGVMLAQVMTSLDSLLIG